MEEALRKKAKEWLQKAKVRLHSVGPILRSLWRAGIPTRFGLLLFVIGIIIGVSAKSWANQNFTIGHDDYLLLPKERVYDLNAAQKRVISGGGSLMAPENASSYPSESVDTDNGQ